MRNFITICESQIVNELHGIKKDAATDFQSKDHVVAFMREKGFKVLGQGQWGAVFDHADFHGRYVLKLFSDQFYEAFLQFCVANKENPHLPRVYGKIMTVGPGSMVRIERLQPFHADEQTEEFLDDVGYDISVRHRVTQIQLATAENLGLSALIPTMLALGKATPRGAAYDIHAENIMTRGDTLVITDPWGGDYIPFLR